MRILVTGGAGFIGSHIADALSAAGHAVAVFDNLSTGRLGNVPAAAEFFEADIRDADAVRDVFDRFRPEAIVHQAAQVDVRSSVADPAGDAHVNIVGSINVLEACREAGARRVLFASTGGAIYGEQDRFPADETHATRPVSPYGVAKLAVEAYLFYYRVAYGVEYAALRYANVYGPRQNPHGEAGVVAIFADHLLRGITATINGDGDQTRDYVYVGDVVRANVLALERGLSGVFNVGTGVETTVNQIFDGLRSRAGDGVDARHGPAKAGEQRRSCLDASKLERDAGWQPEVPLDDGLGETVAYFRRELEKR
jgi:UDP-glucose 4-epimerase